MKRSKDAIQTRGQVRKLLLAYLFHFSFVLLLCQPMLARRRIDLSRQNVSHFESLWRSMIKRRVRRDSILEEERLPNQPSKLSEPYPHGFKYAPKSM